MNLLFCLQQDEEEARRLFAASMVHKSSSVCVEAQVLQKLREAHEQKLLRQKSVSVLGQVSAAVRADNI